MNQFATTENHDIAVKHLNDQRFQKMCVEHAQIMCTALNLEEGKKITPYGSTHVGHGCVKYARTSLQNFEEYYLYFIAMAEEQKRRFKNGVYKKIHSTFDKCLDFDFLSLAEKYLPDTHMTAPHNGCAREETGLCYKHILDPYRAYKVYICARMLRDDKKPKINGVPVNKQALLKEHNVSFKDIKLGFTPNNNLLKTRFYPLVWLKKQPAFLYDKDNKRVTNWKTVLRRLTTLPIGVFEGD